MKLERISEELKESNTQLRTQQNSLKATVITLRKALSEKEALLKNLEDSFNTYESEVMVYQNKQNEKIEGLTLELDKVKKWRRVWCIIACVLGFSFIIFFAIKVFIKRLL